MGILCKGFAIGIGIICAIASMVLAIVFESFWLLLLLFFCAFITSLSWYALGEIIDLLESMNSNIYSINLRNGNLISDSTSAKQNSGGSYLNSNIKPISDRNDIGWVCKCGTRNHSGSVYCKDCGEYKK